MAGSSPAMTKESPAMTKEGLADRLLSPRNGAGAVSGV